MSNNNSTNEYKIADNYEDMIKQYSCNKTRALMKTQFLLPHVKEIFENELKFESDYKILYCGMGADLTNLHIFAEIILNYFKKINNNISKHYHHCLNNDNWIDQHIYISHKLFDHIDTNYSVFDFMNENFKNMNGIKTYHEKNEINIALCNIHDAIKKHNETLALKILNNEEKLIDLFRKFNTEFKKSKMLRVHYIPIQKYNQCKFFNHCSFTKCLYFNNFNIYNPNMHDISIKSYTNIDFCWYKYIVLVEEIFKPISAPVSTSIPTTTPNSKINVNSHPTITAPKSLPIRGQIQTTSSDPVQGIPIYYS